MTFHILAKKDITLKIIGLIQVYNVETESRDRVVYDVEPPCKSSTPKRRVLLKALATLHNYVSDRYLNPPRPLTESGKLPVTYMKENRSLSTNYDIYNDIEGKLEN
jgi:hypothetical protein